MSGMGLFRLHPGFRRASSSSSEDELPPPNTNRVKRALFGPTDHEENLRFVRNELKKARSEASNRWNFDFDSGKPLHGPYDWEEVKSPIAGRSICNPEKHSLIPDPVSGEAKENRVGGDTCDPPGQVTPPVSSVSSPATLPDTSDTLLSSTTPSQDDLKTPPSQSSSVTTSTPPVASSESSSSSSLTTLHSGARPKDSTQAKEKKLTEMYPNRKPRSKSSSNLKLKRLAHGTRSPSVKSRSGVVPGHSGHRVDTDHSTQSVRDSDSKSQTCIPVTVSSHDDSSNSD